MKEITIKTLSGACIMMVCFTPIQEPQEACEFHFVEDNIKVENVVEGAAFYFVPSGSIGIKTQNNK